MGRKDLLRALGTEFTGDLEKAGEFIMETPDSYYARQSSKKDKKPRKTRLEKRKAKVKSAQKYYLDFVELYSFQICGVVFLVINILIIWLMMVPLIEQISDPLEFNRTQLEKDGAYDDTNKEAFKDAFGSLGVGDSVLDAVVDQLSSGNMASGLDQVGMDVGGLDGLMQNMEDNGMGR